MRTTPVPHRVVPRLPLLSVVTVTVALGLAGPLACGGGETTSTPTKKHASQQTPPPTKTPEAKQDTPPAKTPPDAKQPTAASEANPPPATTGEPAEGTTLAGTTGGPDLVTATATAAPAESGTGAGTGAKEPTGGDTGDKKDPGATKPSGPVNVLVLREKTAGGASAGQAYVDAIIAQALKVNGWDQGAGKYTTSRSAATAYIGANKPMFGILSLGAFLALRKTHGLRVIGQAEVSAKGGRQYHIISKDHGDLAGCKGKTLASNHLDDKRFIEGVVAGGGFKLADFTVMATRRPVQTIKKVTSGDAACALVDDAQFADLGSVTGGSALKSVWKSKKLPPMPVVAFRSASAGVRKQFRGNLSKVCSGAGKSACSKAGIVTLKASSDGAYKSVTSAYK